MNDKELADAVVALGVGSISIRDGDNEYCICAAFIRADQFVRDWRVTGALIEMCEARCVDWEDLEPGHWRNMNHTSNTPRAITETCVGLLTTGDKGNA